MTTEQRESSVGRKVSLWSTDYEQRGYRDQFGLWHEAYIVSDMYLATIVEERAVKGSYGGDGVGWRAEDEEGRVFYCNWNYFPDESMSPSYGWTMEGRSSVEIVDACQHYNNFTYRPILMSDRTVAVPLGGQICEEHHYAFMPESRIGCFKCWMREQEGGKPAPKKNVSGRRDPTWRQESPRDQMTVILGAIGGEVSNMGEGVASKAAPARVEKLIEHARRISALLPAAWPDKMPE